MELELEKCRNVEIWGAGSTIRIPKLCLAATRGSKNMHLEQK
jgi:hypothetical protein